MRRGTFALLGAIAALGTTGALAGPSSNDDENDYEGRVTGEEKSTYFGFDVSENGKRVNGITAHLFYRCENGKAGELLVETEGGLRVEHGEFSGKTTAVSKLDPVTYKTTGSFGDEGKAKGTIEAKGRLSPGITCTARNDGDWKAKRGRDIDAPSSSRM